jgi:hypothetical protein
MDDSFKVKDLCDSNPVVGVREPHPNLARIVQEHKGRYADICSGVFINENTVLSAKHCFTYDFGYEFDVFVKSLSNKEDHRSVKRIELHPKKDLAIIFLEYGHSRIQNDVVVGGLTSNYVRVSGIYNNLLSKSMSILTFRSVGIHGAFCGEVRDGNSGGGVFNTSGELIGVLMGGSEFFDGYHITAYTNVDVRWIHGKING